MGYKTGTVVALLGPGKAGRPPGIPILQAAMPPITSHPARPILIFLLPLWCSLHSEHLGEKLWFHLNCHRRQRGKGAGPGNSSSLSVCKEKPGAGTTFFTSISQPPDTMTEAASGTLSHWSPGCLHDSNMLPFNLKTPVWLKCTSFICFCGALKTAPS